MTASNKKFKKTVSVNDKGERVSGIVRAAREISFFTEIA